MVGPELKPTGSAVGGSESTPTLPPAPTGAPTPGLQYYGPTPLWQLLDVREFWRFRDLLWVLAVRDLKVKYRQAVVGVAWVVLQPLGMSLVFVVLFGLLGHNPATGAVPYGVFVLPGVLLWQLFAGTVAQATGSLVANQNLIGKVFFPRLILPAAAAVAALVDFAVGLVVVAVVLAAYGIAPDGTLVFAPLFVALALLVALAVGAWTSALNAIYRDTGFAVPFALQLGMFLSPVVYATDVLIPERWRPLLALNPMTGALDGFRWSLFGGPFPVLTVGLGVATTAVVLLSGLWYFRRVEGYLADRI
jgi:lipopolysaccharide transport system permease protein